MEQTIKNIINTLNMVEVRGRDNMDLMLGAIMALESLVGELSAPPQEDKEE